MEDAFIDAYTSGLLEGVARFAYTSSAAWAEPGVHYVGTTGKTLREAKAEILMERGYTKDAEDLLAQERR